MGKITGFLESDRQERKNQPAADRVRHFREFTIPLGAEALLAQAGRCMDCGIPYCHTGCPVNNQIPDWNDLVWRGDWRRAARSLHSTNNFPEFTGRICPAPCEAACTLNLEDQPVTIKTIECAIIDRAFAENWVQPQPASAKTGKKIAVVGSGPAGLAAAQQLARAGHEVHVYEKHAKAGGLLRYGIPDFKMEKALIDRRLAQMEAEGVVFHYGHFIEGAKEARRLRSEMDALLLTGGAEHPRDLPVEGRALSGVHFAMAFLPQQNRRVSGEALGDDAEITAAGKHVVVIGGGDTGSDCIGTSFRQGALSVTQLEIMSRPPARENKLLVWPDWPMKLRTSSSQEEGAARDWSVSAQKFSGRGGRVEQIHCIRVDETMQPAAGSEFMLRADLILLAMGFVHPVHEGLLQSLGVALDKRGNVAANDDDYRTSLDKVFVAGDMRRGQSLVVWAIREGRQAARAIDMFLMGKTDLPR